MAYFTVPAKKNGYGTPFVSFVLNILIQAGLKIKK